MRRFSRPVVPGAMVGALGWTLCMPPSVAAADADKTTIIRIACAVQPGDQKGNLCGPDAVKRWEEKVNIGMEKWAKGKKAFGTVKIEILPTPINTNEQLRVYSRYLNSNEPEHRADILEIDVIWATYWAEFLKDIASDCKLKGTMKHFIKKDLRDHVRLEEYCVMNSNRKHSLKAVPWFQNVGLLYYRGDILKSMSDRLDLERKKKENDKSNPISKSDNKDDTYPSIPPRTWNELEQWSKMLMSDKNNFKNERERRHGEGRKRKAYAGGKQLKNNNKKYKENNEYWLGDEKYKTIVSGFVFQGADYEGLFCNALEWMGAGKSSGNRSANGGRHLTEELGQEVLKRAASWIGGITPPGVLFFNEQQSREAFRGGHAVFMRHWPTASRLLDRDELDFGVAPLPGRSGQGDHAGCLGGAGLAISKISEHPELAAFVIRELSSVDEQVIRFKEGYYAPTRKSILEDKKMKFLEGEIKKKKLLRTLSNILINNDHIAVRPAKKYGKQYPDVSEAITTAIHNILSGRSPGEEERILKEAKKRIENINNSR